MRERHLHRVIKEYVAYFNQARPHQGIEQKIPEGPQPVMEEQKRGKVIAFPVLTDYIMITDSQLDHQKSRQLAWIGFLATTPR